MHLHAYNSKTGCAIGQPAIFLIFVMPFCRPFWEVLPLRPV